jgi:hypothetical protein
LAEEVGSHVGEDVGAALFVAARDFGGGPAGVLDFGEGFADVCPVDVAFTDVDEAALDGPVLDVEFDDAFAELADPGGGFAEFLVVSDVEVGADPWGVDFVELVAEEFGVLVVVAFGVVEELVPDVFDEDVDAEVCGEGEGFADAGDGAFPGLVVGGFVVDDGWDEEDSGAADGVGFADGGEEAIESFGAGFFGGV